jgi:hypothetical protein
MLLLLRIFMRFRPEAARWLSEHGVKIANAARRTAGTMQFRRLPVFDVGGVTMD